MGGVPLKKKKKNRIKWHALVNGFRITVVLLMNPLSVSISYITSPLASSTRVVFKGESLVKTSLIAIESCQRLVR